jgi:type VI secretion system secreted protein Hcp
MANDFHLDLEGVKGESEHADHKGQIAIMSFNWGLSNPAQITGSGMGQSTVSFQDIHFTKSYDKASPVMAQHLAKGKHFTNATFTCRKPGDGQKDYLVIKMKQLFITSISNSSGGNGEIHESISCAYKDIEISYKSQDSKGALGGEIKFAFDLAAVQSR